MSEPTTAEVLRRAADLMEKGGLCKLGYFDEEGRHCLVGALKRAKGDVLMSNVADALPFVAGVAFEQFPDRCLAGSTGFGRAVSFNDHVDTVKEDVVAVLEKAAVRASEPTFNDPLCLD